MNKVYLFVPLMFYSIPSDFRNKSYKRAFFSTCLIQNLFLLQNALFLCTKKRLITRYFVNYEKIAVDGAGCCHADPRLWK